MQLQCLILPYPPFTQAAEAGRFLDAARRLGQRERRDVFDKGELRELARELGVKVGVKSLHNVFGLLGTRERLLLRLCTQNLCCDHLLPLYAC